MTSPSTGDFTLKSGAPVIGKAKVLSGFSNDAVNNARGSSWDIGAYEYVASPAGSVSPVVAMMAPAADATVSGASITVSDNGSGNPGAVGVQSRLDGANLRSADSTVEVSNSSVVWVDDALPSGAQPGPEGGDGWNWTSSSPTPFSGTQSHLSAVSAGANEHYFYAATATLTIEPGDTLFTYVYLDPANLPSEVMLQWSDGYSWEHRAFWGANLILNGTDSTASRYYMGPLPPAGQWVRLEVPASLVGLENVTLSGMSFTLSDGQAAWDATGKSPPVR